MVNTWANGISGTTHNQSWISDPDWFETRMNLPGMTPGWNGEQWGLIIGLRPSVGGQSGGVSTRAWVSNADGGDWRGTNVFGIGQGYAGFQSWQGLTSPKLCFGGQELRYGVDQQWGTQYIGRSAVGGRNINSGNPGGYGWPGYAIGMEVMYLTLPSSPGTPGLSTPGIGALSATWSAPGWNGDTGITNYYFDYANNPAFNGFSRIVTNSNPEVSITGLTGGATYYCRVYAINAVASAANTASVPSGVSSIVVQGAPPVPPDPQPIVKVSTAGAWVAINRLNVDISQGVWKPHELRISNGSAWQTPIA